MDLDWLRHLPAPVPEHELSRNGRLGLAVARQLERYWGDDHGAGVDHEAREYGVTASTVRRWIHTAHHELHRERRPCMICDQPLPLGARRSRRYCDQHNTVLARVHRHRQTQRNATRDAPSPPGAPRRA